MDHPEDYVKRILKVLIYYDENESFMSQRNCVLITTNYTNTQGMRTMFFEKLSASLGAAKRIQPPAFLTIFRDYPRSILLKHPDH